MHEGKVLPLASLYNKTYIGKYSFSEYGIVFIDSKTSLTTVATNIKQGESTFEGFNIASGICMVFLLLIVAAIILSAFNVFLRRNNRRTRSRSLEHEMEGGGLHQHLPVRSQYSDQPPSYAAMQSYTHVTTPAGDQDHTRIITNFNVVSKTEDEESIAVHWSYSDSDEESKPPPVFPCVVVENAIISSVDEEPPSYQNSVAVLCSD